MKNTSFHKRIQTKLPCLLLIAMSVWCTTAYASQKAPEFSLPDTAGKMQSLSDQKGKYVVLEWTNNDCPFVRKQYDSGNMQKLQERYVSRGVVWFSVNSSAPGKQGYYSPAEWKEKIRTNGSKATAVLLDSDGKIGKLYGAQTTPHMFVIDPEGLLIYEGAIDDRPGIHSDTAKAHNYVTAALEQAMAGQKVSIQKTKSYGCSVKYAD